MNDSTKDISHAGTSVDNLALATTINTVGRLGEGFVIEYGSTALRLLETLDTTDAAAKNNLIELVEDYMKDPEKHNPLSKSYLILINRYKELVDTYIKHQ